MVRIIRALAAVLFLVAAPVLAQQSTREALVQASFIDRDKATALRRVEAVLADPAAEPVVRATAFGYRAKLTGSRADLSAARKLFDATVRAQPRNAEAQLGLGAWHLGVVGRTGALLGRVFGASRSTGYAALERAVAAGGDRAFYPGLAALLRLRADPGDVRGRQLAEQAARAPAPAQLDRIMQRAVQTVLGDLRSNDKAGAKRAAGRLLPLGGIPGMSD